MEGGADKRGFLRGPKCKPLSEERLPLEWDEDGRLADLTSKSSSSTSTQAGYFLGLCEVLRGVGLWVEMPRMEAIFVMYRGRGGRHESDAFSYGLNRA